MDAVFDLLAAVRSFHEEHGHHIAEEPTLAVGDDVVELRLRLIDEEVRELRQALADGDLIKVADALGDIACVVYGTAVSFGIPLNEVTAEIHRSNMTKEPKGANGKSVKGEGYEEPQLAAILARAGYRPA